MIPPSSTVESGSPRARTARQLRVGVACSPCPLAVPAWVRDLLGGGAADEPGDSPETASGFRVRRRTGGNASLVSVTVPGARSLNDTQLRERTRGAYEVHRDLAGEAWHPVRVWNFIPGITEPVPTSPGHEGLDRYMAFNLGRHDAVGAWFGHRDAGRLPSATGVGHAGDDLVVHMLLLASPPVSIENPRQRPAFRYSERFGPKPPCFSRASLIEHAGDRTLLIAGTASILGEVSLHPGAIREQIDETFANLRALIGAAAGGDADATRRFENVRAYSPDPAHDGVISAELESRLGGRPFEIVRADLCRAELLVEIEGTARVGEAPLGGGA